MRKSVAVFIMEIGINFIQVFTKFVMIMQQISSKNLEVSTRLYYVFAVRNPNLSHISEAIFREYILTVEILLY